MANTTDNRMDTTRGKAIVCASVLAVLGALSACVASDEGDSAAGKGGGGASVGSGSGGDSFTTGAGPGSFGGGLPSDGSGSGSGENNGESCDGKLTGRVRDFHDSFPDMEPAHSGKCDNCDDHAVVTDTIGDDLKPVYAGPLDGTQTTTGKDNFDKWYRDVDTVNAATDLVLQFVDPDGDGVFTHDDQEFFPIDDQLYGNEGRPHNYHFTYELHTNFIYHGGEVFSFTGDDDVWVYIDGKKVVDLGGVHSQETSTVTLDALGFRQGQTYRLDFFFAERHVTDSHFRIDTTIQFVDCGVVIR
jgi:fibro-slime domain-containing protein